MCLSLYQIVPEDLCINDNEYCHLALGIIENEIVLNTKSARILRRNSVSRDKTQRFLPGGLRH